MKRWLILAAAVGMVFRLAGAAAAGEELERFLPEHTMMYVGVERLEEGYDTIVFHLKEARPSMRQFLEDGVFLRTVAENLLYMKGIENRSRFIEATGLDRNGSAGIARVLTDPAFSPRLGPNEGNFLVFLPVRDAARMEAALQRRVLPEFNRRSSRICRETLRRIREVKSVWQRENEAAARETIAPTWSDLATAWPGLRPMRCPGGGSYAIGDPARGPVCSVHGDGSKRPGAEPAPTRENLGVKTVGDVTMVGGRAKGAAWAWTDTHIILSSNPNVLEDAVAAATTGATGASEDFKRLRTRNGRVLLNLGHLLYDVERKASGAGGGRGPGSGESRATALLKSAGRITADIGFSDSFQFDLIWTIEKNPWTEPLLNVPPASSGAIKLTPASAIAAAWGPIAPEVFSIIGDFKMMDKPLLAALFKLIAGACEGDGAFAVTPGTSPDGTPNMLLVLRLRDRKITEPVLDAWTALAAREMDFGELRTASVGGVKITTLDGGDGVSVHYAFIGDYLAVGASVRDLREVVALRGGGAGKSLIASSKYRRVELRAGPANLVVFVDSPELARLLEESESKRNARKRNRACLRNMKRLESLTAAYRTETGEPPRGFDALREHGPDPGRGDAVRDWCVMFGRDVKLALAPTTGAISCPRHGSVVGFKPVDPPPGPRLAREKYRSISSMGLWGLRLVQRGGKLYGEGRIIPMARGVAGE